MLPWQTQVQVVITFHLLHPGKLEAASSQSKTVSAQPEAGDAAVLASLQEERAELWSGLWPSPASFERTENQNCAKRECREIQRGIMWF